MTLKLNGSSSGYTAIDAPAAAGSNTLVLPTSNGSANQILQTDGSGNLSWVDKPTGGLINTEYQRITAQANTTGSSDVDTGTTVTITPTSASSTILILVSGATYTYQDGGGDTLGVYKILRGATVIHEWYHGIYESSDTNNLAHKTATTAHVVDSPNTTSATTYKVQMKKIYGDGIYWSYNSLPSTITVMELAV